MKKWEAPCVEIREFHPEDVMTASGEWSIEDED